jgi:hypothetical protein
LHGFGAVVTSLAWKVNRLRAMGVSEVVYRLRQSVRASVEQLGFGLAKPTMARGTCGLAWSSPLARDFNASRYLTAADEVLAGRFDVFAMRGLALGFPPNWNRDPKTQINAPMVFGKELNYRDERIVGDIKYLWEPNRHLELVTLAQAYYLSGDERLALACRHLLESWFEQCPYPFGANWTSSLEHGVRLVNWAVAWHLLGAESSSLFIGAEGQDFRQRWFDSIFQHCHFIAGHLSRHSSANNHLLGELTGLFVGSLTWPMWPQSERWRQLAEREFEAEALKQTSPDGVNREQAFLYHHWVADMMLLGLLFGRSNGAVMGSEFEARLESMLDFVVAVMDTAGHVPAVGDADDAVMVRFSHAPEFDVYKSLLATGAVLFRRPIFAAKAGIFDDKSRWLLGDGAQIVFDDLKAQATPCHMFRRAFADGGYWVLGSRFDTSLELRIVADAGPLGYLGTAAHGHADALAFTLSFAGQQLLIDPGTYAYHTQSKWRDYFRGTSAHNTVRVDGLDQSVIGGNFLWLRHLAAKCLRWEDRNEKCVWIGEHDGYQRLRDPLMHRREIVLDKTSSLIEVFDTLTCADRHFIEVFWHFSENCVLTCAGRVVHVSCGEASMTLEMPGCDWIPTIVVGQDDPPSGWISRRFDEKAASPTLKWSGEALATCSLRTVITLELT